MESSELSDGAFKFQSRSCDLRQGASTKKDSSKHVPTALLSSDLVCGENAVVGVRVGVRVRVMVIDRVSRNAVVGAIAVPLSSDYLRNKWDR